MNAYIEAYRLAGERLSGLSSETVCLNSKAAFSEETGAYSLRYFGQECRIVCAGGTVEFESPAELPTTEKVLVLHYLINSGPAPLTGRLISFKEVPNGGLIYYSTFKKRAIDPLINTFSDDPKGLAEAAVSIGGVKESYGDASVSVNIFPLVPVTYAVWRGDEEVAPSGTVLFDASVTDFLPVEDIVVAASYGTYRLMHGYKCGKRAGA